MTLVITGLCFFAKNSSLTSQNTNSYSKWVPYALGCFLIQMIALTLIQWRCLLFCEESQHFLIPATLNERDDVWFMPSFFGSAFIIQGVWLLFERKPLRMQDMVYGLSGGVANGASTFFYSLRQKWLYQMNKRCYFLVLLY